MVKRLWNAAVIASVAVAGVSAVPAAAQDHGWGRHYQSYDQDDRYNDDGDRYAQNAGYRDDRQQEEYRRYRDEQRHYEHARRNPSYDRGYASNGYVQGYADRGSYSRAQYRNRRCSSGTTGAVLGAVLGGLLGREIGRGGRYNEPSTTGLIVGAGGGALAGRAIERSGNCR